MSLVYCLMQNGRIDNHEKLRGAVRTFSAPADAVPVWPRHLTTSSRASNMMQNGCIVLEVSVVPRVEYCSAVGAHPQRCRSARGSSWLRAKPEQSGRRP